MPRKPKKKYQQKQKQSVVINIGTSHRRRGGGGGGKKPSQPSSTIQYVPYNYPVMQSQQQSQPDNGLLASRIQQLEENIKSSPPIINTATPVAPIPIAPIPDIGPPPPAKNYFSNEPEPKFTTPYKKDLTPTEPFKGYDFNPQKPYAQNYPDLPDILSDVEPENIPVRKYTPLLDRTYVQRKRTDDETRPTPPAIPRGEMQALTEEEKKERKRQYQRDYYQRKKLEKLQKEQEGED